MNDNKLKAFQKHTQEQNIGILKAQLQLYLVIVFAISHFSVRSFPLFLFFLSLFFTA